jgi:hypothetical protein
MTRDRDPKLDLVLTASPKDAWIAIFERLWQSFSAPLSADHAEQEVTERERKVGELELLDIRAITFEQTVRNVDQGFDAGAAQKARKQRGGSGAVDVVIAEDGDRLAALDGVGDARGGLRHGGQHVRIWHRSLDRRVEEFLHRVDPDIAAGENAGEQLGQIVPLRDGERARRSAHVQPVAPCAPGGRAFDAEKEAIRHGELA